MFGNTERLTEDELSNYNKITSKSQISINHIYCNRKLREDKYFESRIVLDIGEQYASPTQNDKDSLMFLVVDGREERIGAVGTITKKKFYEWLDIDLGEISRFIPQEIESYYVPVVLDDSNVVISDDTKELIRKIAEGKDPFVSDKIIQELPKEVISIPEENPNSFTLSGELVQPSSGLGFIMSPEYWFFIKHIFPRFIGKEITITVSEALSKDKKYRLPKMVYRGGSYIDLETNRRVDERILN